MLKAFLKGLVGRLLGYSVFGLGFWFLFQGFLRPHIPLAVLGGGMVLAGMYLMVTARTVTARDKHSWCRSLDLPPALPVVDSTKDKERNSGGPIIGGDKGNKLPS
jgi:hypothetical protein